MCPVASCQRLRDLLHHQLKGKTPIIRPHVHRSEVRISSKEHVNGVCGCGLLELGSYPARDNGKPDKHNELKDTRVVVMRCS